MSKNFKTKTNQPTPDPDKRSPPKKRTAVNDIEQRHDLEKVPFNFQDDYEDTIDDSDRNRDQLLRKDMEIQAERNSGSHHRELHTAAEEERSIDDDLLPLDEVIDEQTLLKRIRLQEQRNMQNG